MHRWPIRLMIPLNLLLILWIWFGRIVFGVGGWFFLILVPVVLVVALALLATTILALTQRGRPRSLTGLPYGAQLATWLGLLGFGAFLPDFGDADDSYVSLLTNAFGYSDGLMDLSWAVTLGFAGVGVVGYLVLLVSLVVGRRSSPVAVPA